MEHRGGIGSRFFALSLGPPKIRVLSLGVLEPIRLSPGIILLQQEMSLLNTNRL